MANINILGRGAGDPPRQKRRQSKDFNEIVNLHSDMVVTDEKWDFTFHNWESPDACRNNRLGHKCIVCEEIERTGQYVNKITGEIYDKYGKTKNK